MLSQEILNLSPSERLQLVEDIWDSLADLKDTLQVTPAQRAELGKRLAKYKDQPHGGIPWTEVKHRMLG